MQPASCFRAAAATVLAVAATASFASASSATTYAAQKPTTFAHDGLRATWSKVVGLAVEKPGVDTAMVEPGQRFAIRVRATKKAARSARVRITGTREAGEAGPKRVVLRKSVRSGTVGLRVAKVPGTYRVQVRIGKRVRNVQVVVEVRTSPDAAPKPAPVPVCDPNLGFLAAPPGVVAPSIAPVTVVNQGSFPLLYGGGVIWERQEGAGWATAPFPTNFTASTFKLTAAPGAVIPRVAVVWSLDTGTYRAALPVRCADSGVEGVLYSAPVAVTRRVYANGNGSPVPLPLGNDIAPPPPVVPAP
ncbi:MAG: hypothetical protein WC558_04680 [Patulibacter sp.]